MPKSKEYVSDSSDASSAEEAPKSKKAKKQVSKTSASSNQQKGDGEPRMYSLSKSRSVNVSTFRDKVLVNIREYYEKDGKQLPGKKGISLTLEQWDKLKQHMKDIDADVETLA